MARYYNRGWRRSWYRRGGAKSSKQGSATFTCRIPVEDVIQFKIPASAEGGTQYNWSQLMCTCPYASFVGTSSAAEVKKYLTKASLLDSYLYRTYTKIYDQVKINAVSVSLGLMEGIGNAGQLAALRLYTNWDRDLNFEEITGTALPSSPEELATGSESQSYLIVNNSRQTFRRYVVARDVQERTTYHDCSYSSNPSGNGIAVGYLGDDQWAPLMTTTAGITTAVAYGHSRDCGFVPSLMMSLWSPTTFAADRVIPCSLKVTYSVTFRMPKFGLASSSPSRATISGLRMDAVEDVKAEIEEEKKSDEEMQKEEPVLKKKKVVYEEEMVPDDEPEEEDSEDQTPLTQPFKSPMKKAGKKS